jgi:hypothetical protein
VLVMFSRNVLSGFRRTESSGSRLSCSVAVLVDISSPKARSRSCVDVKCEPMSEYDDLTVPERLCKD